MKNFFRRKKNYKKYLWYIPLALVLLGVYYLPPVQSRLAWRVDELHSRIKYFFNPPDQAVFLPAQTDDFESILATTRAEYSLTLTPAFTETSTPTPVVTLTPTITATPPPGSVSLSGVKYESQSGHNNYCGPTNFSMALTFWGWKGSRSIIGDALMPGNRLDKNGKSGDNDKNVMPYEFQDYITGNVPGMKSAVRYGGDIDVLKRLIAGGFPVIAEKGIYELDMLGKVSWMGHYQFVTGYDDATREMIVQDSYLAGPNFRIKYDEFMNSWRAFNYLFLVVYPEERESEVVELLGELADQDTAARIALEVAKKEVITLTGNDQFWAAFNVGTSHVALLEYVDAADAYDNAFGLYSGLSTDMTSRPYRVMWYQTGPYYAYYYSNRFSDVINLADTTLNDTISKPILEESLLWRGRAYYMAGDTQSALADYRAALNVHVKWVPAMQALQDLGVQP
ncbi:MAG TPA: C39 family peptidase [Anaerolineales bacterium]|nr:C39 family peptidase [Anaerolineales bacterium]